jgi:hypothetical protein
LGIYPADTAAAETRGDKSPSLPCRLPSPQPARGTLDAVSERAGMM